DASGGESERAVKFVVRGGGSEARGPDGRHMHGGEWRDEHEWPLARTRWTPYYLHGDGTLSAAPPAEPNRATSYDFDPRDPVPTIGGNISSAFSMVSPEVIMHQGA